MIGFIAQTFQIFDRASNSTDDSLTKSPMQSIELRRSVITDLSQEGEIDFSQVQDDIQEILVLDPLSNAALSLYAQSQLMQGKPDSLNSEIYKTLISRNPRNSANLRAFFSYSLRNGNISAALETLDFLFKLEEKSQQDTIVASFSALYTLPEGRKIINDRLRDIPQWGWRFLRLETLSATPENIDAVTKSLKIYLDASPDVIPLFPQIDVMSRKLVDIGQVDSAYELWHFATEKAEGPFSAEETLNFNPEIKKSLSPAPFNWYFPLGDDAVIEQSRDQTYVSFQGSTKATVVTQYFIPKAEPITLLIQANYRYENQKGNFLVSVECLNFYGEALSTEAPYKDSKVQEVETAEARTRSVRLDGRFQSGERHSHSFEPFENRCKLASLSIVADPGVFNERLSATFNFVGVRSESRAIAGDTP